MFFAPPNTGRALPKLEPTVLQALSPRRAKIALEPFLRGAAGTLGDTLKRVLLPTPGACSQPGHWHEVAVVDAALSPVRRLDFAVEPARRGTCSDLERLVVDIETDGSVTPVEALWRGARILMSMMNCLSIVKKEPVHITPPPRPSWHRHDPILVNPIDTMGLSVRTANGLRALGIQLIGDLIRFSAAELLRAPYLGRRSLIDIEDALRARGLMLADGFKD